MSAIRAASETDLHRCREIGAAALAEPWPDLLGSALASDAVFPVVTVDGEVAGYAIAFAAAADAPAYVPEFAIEPDRQGQGLGTALMAALCERLAARGQRQVRLTVHAADERAWAFYRDRGFEVIERRPDHYDDGDALLLSRELAATGGSHDV